MAEKKPNNKNSNARRALIIVAVMVAAVAVMLYFGINAVTGGGGARNDVSVSLPVITTELTVPSTGEDVDLQTLFTVLVPREARADVSDDILEESLSAIMLELDAERLFAGDRVEYINTNATELLNQRLAEMDIETRVILTDISSSKYAQLTDPGQGSNDVSSGLFQNLD